MSRNNSRSSFGYNRGAARVSTFTCECGQEYNDQITLDEHKKMNCTKQKFSCPFCEEYLPDLTTRSKHLFRCGSKTEQCPICQKYIHRAEYNCHVENNCINLDEDNINSNILDSERYLSTNSLIKDEQRNKFPDQSLENSDASFERIKIDFNQELFNTAEDQRAHTKESAISSLHGKASQVHESLRQEFYPTEIDHVVEKVQFNIILMGAPRVGKSQLINAICNGEKKAETSSSLNSCTREVTCYSLEDDQQRTPGIKPFRINFYDTPGIESWTNTDGKTTMLKFIEDKNPICVIYCAAPGTFADLSQVRPVLEFCKEKQIFWAFVCTNMWSNASRNEVIREFETELAIFGTGIEKLFDQTHSKSPHKVKVFDNHALCTMINSVEYYDPDFSPERKPVQGIDELIHSIMEALDNEKLLGWCNAVLHRRTYWEKFNQKFNGFLSLRLKNIQNIKNETPQSMKDKVINYIRSMIA